MVPPEGFEPSISTLKGWRPGPLDDGGTRGTADSSGFSPRRQSGWTNACSKRRTTSSIAAAGARAFREKIPEIFLSADVCSFGCAARASTRALVHLAHDARVRLVIAPHRVLQQLRVGIFGLPFARRTSKASAEARRRRLCLTAEMPMNRPPDEQCLSVDGFDVDSTLQAVHSDQGRNTRRRLPGWPGGETERLVSRAGLEPATPCLKGRCSNRLS